MYVSVCVCEPLCRYMDICMSVCECVCLSNEPEGHEVNVAMSPGNNLGVPTLLHVLVD